MMPPRKDKRSGPESTNVDVDDVDVDEDEEEAFERLMNEMESEAEDGGNEDDDAEDSDEVVSVSRRYVN
jgi:hypothetical protein